MAVLVTLVWISGCSPVTHSRFSPNPSDARATIPASPPPETLVRLVLERPQGGTGNIRIIKEVSYAALPSFMASRPKYSTQITFSNMGIISATDDIGQWSFAYELLSLGKLDSYDYESATNRTGLHGLGIRFVNATQNHIEVDWSRCVLVAPDGRTYKLIHKGTTLRDRMQQGSPSVIPPSARLEDFVFPSELVRFDYNMWVGEPFFETMDPGTNIRLVLLVRFGGEEQRKEFVFRAQVKE